MTRYRTVCTRGGASGGVILRRHSALTGCPALRMLARTMLEHGIEAYVTCVDLSKLTEPFVGRRWDSKFLHDLPASADPCGEYGEFHTVVLGGPMFRCRIDAHVGDRFLSKGFAFADVRLKLKSVSP